MPTRPKKRIAKADTDSTVANQESKDSFPIVGIVGIVASAGGLEAFKTFFSNVSLDCGMAFILVPHLDSKRESKIVEILSRHTTLPVVAATDGLPVSVNCIYIIPPNQNLTFSNGTLRLSPLPKTIGNEIAMDFFLRSLAEDQGERAIGVVLSGTGSHGTLGIREIKRCGGMAMAQSPESAEFDQMPSNAIKTGLVDFILSPELMPEALANYVRQPYVNREQQLLSTSDEVTSQFAETLALISSLTSCDFRSYRPQMLMRRIERRMGLLQSVNFSSYLETLRAQPNEVHAFCKDFQIGVTTFFRDPESFEILAKCQLAPETVPPVCASNSTTSSYLNIGD